MVRTLIQHQTVHHVIIFVNLTIIQAVIPQENIVLPAVHHWTIKNVKKY